MPSADPIFQVFQERQAEEGRALSQASDILRLERLDTGQHFVATYSSHGLIQTHDGSVREADRFQVGIFFAEDYLRTVRPFELLTLFGPMNTDRKSVV